LNEPDRRLFEATATGNLWQLPDCGFNLRYSMRYLRDLLRIYSYRLEIREGINAVKSYKKILVNSLFSRESVKRAYGVGSVVCYPGVSAGIFNYNPLIKKKPFIAGMGRISQAKNIELAISAVALIPIEERPVLFWISNGLVNDYFLSMEKLAAERNVDFRPLIDIKDEEIVNVLNEAAVFISTSHLEPFGLAPLEANLCGTYVVSVAEGGFRETICQGQNGSLVSTGSPADLAAAIRPFCLDLEMATERGKLAREHCLTNWDLALMAEKIENELHSITI
jgi:glycosyltransferase involved in cell wall biosynthesis